MDAMYKGKQATYSWKTETFPSAKCSFHRSQIA